MHPDPDAARVVDGERPVARVDEHVDAQVRQVDLAIGADHAIGSGQNAGVEEPRAVPLEQPEDAVAPGSLAGRDDLAHRGPVDRDGMRQALLAAGEPVAREGALGEDHEVRPGRGRLAEPLDDAREVLVEPAQLRVHLDGGHAIGRCGIQGWLIPA